MPFQPTILPVDIGSSATISVSSGNFGGFTVMLQASPITGQTATAYTTGQVVGGLVALTGASRVAGGSGLIQSAAVSFLSGISPSLDICFWNALPSASTFTNNSTLVVGAADVGKIIGISHLSDVSTLGAISFVQATALALPYVIAAGSTVLYACIIARSSFTLGSTSDASLTVRCLQD